MESLILGATSTGFSLFLLLFFSRSRAFSHGSFTRDSREIARFTSSCPTIRIRIEDARGRLEKDPKDECYPDAWLQLSFLRNRLTSRRFSVACKRISKDFRLAFTSLHFTGIHANISSINHRVFTLSLE